jgi:hypothetical protein
MITPFDSKAEVGDDNLDRSKNGRISAVYCLRLWHNARLIFACHPRCLAGDAVYKLERTDEYDELFYL